MTPFDHFLLRFLLASAGCLAAGAAVGTLLILLRRLPAMALQRSTWLLGQLTIAAAFLVIVLPHSERLRVVPPIEIEGPSQTAQQVASTPTQPAPAAAATALGAAPEPSLLAYAARAWAAIYLLGFVYTNFKLWRSWRLLQGLAHAGAPLDRLPRHAAFSAAPGVDVIEVDAPISPMLFGVFRPRLLLPRHLRSFEPIQQQLIVAHELTHLRRRDLHWMCAALMLESLFWFNPVMRLLRTQLSWAQELGCDRDVLAERPRAQHRHYASALVAQLKMQHQPLHAALAFGGVNVSTVMGRIALIREPLGAGRGRWTRVVAIGALALVVAGSLALQPALAWRITSLECTAISDAASGAALAQEGQCESRVTPASTFNIPISLMGYDSGFLVDEHTPALPFKPGYPDWIDSWRQTTDPASFLSNSVLWYAQQVTAGIGERQFQRYVRQFAYGNQDVSGDPGKDNGLSMSWVGSSLAISPAEQIGFLRKVVNRQLQLSPQAYAKTARIMSRETLPNGWEVYGKTGTASYILPNGQDDDSHQYGWYVGWASKGGRTIVFARLVLHERQGDDHAGPRVKRAFLKELPGRLDKL